MGFLYFMGSMAGIDKERYEQLKKQRTFYKFTYRGLEIEQLLELKNEEFSELVHARARRRFQRGLKRKPMALMKKLRKAKKETKVGEKPATIKTHLRDMIVMPEMVGSVVGIYNGKQFNAVEIKGEMIGRYLAEFSLTYEPVRHGRPGIGASHSSHMFQRMRVVLATSVFVFTLLPLAASSGLGATCNQQNQLDDCGKFTCVKLPNSTEFTCQVCSTTAECMVGDMNGALYR